MSTRTITVRSFALLLSIVLALPTQSYPLAPLPSGGSPGMYPSPPVPVALAAAAAILSIASSIKGFFDSEDQKRTQQEILNKLSEIQAKLDEMDKKLDIIIERFAELEFHIDQKFEEQRAIDVLTTIKRINQHYPTWTQKGYKPGVKPAVPDPGPILEELRRTTTALRETPSYANFATVALSMAYERLLLIKVFRVKPTDADMQRGFAQICDLFRERRLSQFVLFGSYSGISMVPGKHRLEFISGRIQQAAEATSMRLRWNLL